METTSPVVALTFDDGPHPEHTPRVLGLLRDLGVRATFFVVGESAALHPELVDRIRADGHEVANHSWSHPSFPRLSRARRAEEVRRWREWMSVRGVRSGLFRFPWGHQMPASRLELTLAGWTVVGWDVDPGDYVPGRSGSEILERLGAEAAPGSIVLLHDVLHDDPGRSRDGTLEAVEGFLGRGGAGLSPVTLSELLAMGRPVRDLAFVDPRPRHGAPGGPIAPF